MQKDRPMKERGTVILRRLASGEVIAEIVDEAGGVKESRNFGVMTEDEYKGLLRLLERQHPLFGGSETIELTGN